MANTNVTADGIRVLAKKIGAYRLLSISCQKNLNSAKCFKEAVCLMNWCQDSRVGFCPFSSPGQNILFNHLAKLCMNTSQQFTVNLLLVGKFT